MSESESGHRASLTDLGLIFMVNILLISNYFFVRSLRKRVDNPPVPRSDDTTATNRRTSSLLVALHERFTSSRLVVGFRQSSERSSEAIPTDIDKRDEPEPGPDRKCTLSCIQNSAFAFVCGRHILEPSLEKRFPKWKPIPYKLGILSTCCALLLTIVLLSTEIAEDRISVDVINRSGSSGNSSGFCEDKEFEYKISNFTQRMNNATNYVTAKKQNQTISSFATALIHDTSEYGTDQAKCPLKKADYEDPTNTDKQGPFFPAYCEAALKLSILAADETCAKKERICTDVLSCNKTETPVVCPPHSNDADNENTKNYRLKQLQKLAEEKAQEFTMNEFDQEDFQQRSTIIVGDLLKQINIAGTLYSLYVCVGLFFPSPLRLFRPAITVRMKQILFGVDKKTFIILVLVIWWLYQYVEIVTSSYQEHNRAVTAYIRNLIKDPCFLDTRFVAKRYEVWNEMCTDLTNFENEWELAKVQINQIKPEVEEFDNSCNCHFSGNALNAFADENDTYDDVGFEYTLWKIRGSGKKFWSPNEKSKFKGDTLICEDMSEAQDYIFVAEDADITFWESWVQTGLLANLLVKIAITNFCVALLNLADPFVGCGGTYESPPNMSDQNVDNASGADDPPEISEKVMKDKAAALKAIAIRQCLFWGLITNACLVCLLMVAVSNFGDFQAPEYIVFGSLIVISFSVPCCCFFLTHCMSIATLSPDSYHDTADIEDGLGFPISTPTRGSRSLQTPSTRPLMGSDGSRTPPSRDAISPSHLNYYEQSQRFLRNQSQEESSRLIDGNNSVDEVESLGNDGEVKNLVGHVSTSPLRPRQDNDGSRRPQLRSTNPFNSSKDEETFNQECEKSERESSMAEDEETYQQECEKSGGESSMAEDGADVAIDEEVEESVCKNSEETGSFEEKHNMGAPYSDDDLECLDDLDDLSESHQGGSDDEMSYFSADFANTDMGRSNLLVTQNVEEEGNDDNLSAEDINLSDTSDYEHDAKISLS